MNNVTPTPPNRQRYLLNTHGYGCHQALLDLARPDAHILDVGCATGYFAELLRARRNATVVGLDDDKDACAATRERGFTTIHGSVTSAVVLKRLHEFAPFDHIVLGDVLEHLVEPQHVLLRLQHLLAEGGTYLISIPNIVSIRSRLLILMGRWRYAPTGVLDHTHLRFFTPTTARELLVGAGLEVLETIPVGPLTARLGRAGVRLSAMCPGLLATQVVFQARVSSASQHG